MHMISRVFRIPNPLVVNVLITDDDRMLVNVTAPENSAGIWYWLTIPFINDFPVASDTLLICHLGCPFFPNKNQSSQSLLLLSQGSLCNLCTPFILWQWCPLHLPLEHILIKTHHEKESLVSREILSLLYGYFTSGSLTVLRKSKIPFSPTVSNPSRSLVRVVILFL